MAVAADLERELEVLDCGYVRVYYDIACERLRAACKHSDNSIEVAPYDDARWWQVVMEEIGEVGRAFQESPERVREELLQAAAMVTAWYASSLEEERA